MRFVLYVTILLAVLPLVLARPFFGLCVYYVVSLMQPKFLCWRGDFQDGMLVGVPLVVGAIIVGVRRKTLLPQTSPKTGKIVGIKQAFTRSPPFEPSWMVALLILLVVYISVTRLLVPFPLSANTYYYRSLLKLVLVLLLLTGLVSDLGRFRTLYIVVALASAFWAIKGGIKVVVLGPHQVYGRTYDNNLFALVSVMSLPMVFYYALSVRHGRWRAVLLVCSALICLAVIGSRSRAGFVALVFVLLCMAWSSRYRTRAILAAGLLAVVAWTAASQEIRDRITSIIEYRKDKSAMSRFYTWELARDMLWRNPVIGVGFNNFEIAKDRYVGGQKAAHNIFLQNLVELGLLGHPLWLAVILGTIVTLYRLMRRSQRLPPDMRWAYYWSRGLLLGMLAFCIHGFFHNEEFLELMLVMAGLTVALRSVIRQEQRHRRLYAEAELAGVGRTPPRPAKPAKETGDRWGLMFAPAKPGKRLLWTATATAY